MRIITSGQKNVNSFVGAPKQVHSKAQRSFLFVFFCYSSNWSYQGIARAETEGSAPPVPKPIIYTVGTSNHSKEDFLGLLHHYAIETVVDVRRFPRSRFDHFTKENLASGLEKEGIDYLYFGKELGGFRKGGYEAYTKSANFQQSIDRLELTAKKGSTAVTCAERFPWKCHRRFIASSLILRGWQVVHIIDKDRVWSLKDASEEHAENQPV